MLIMPTPCQISLDFSFSGVSRHSVSIILSVLTYFASKVGCFPYTKRVSNPLKCADTSSSVHLQRE